MKNWIGVLPQNGYEGASSFWKPQYDHQVLGPPGTRVTPIWYLLLENKWLLSDPEGVQILGQAKILHPGPTGPHGKEARLYDLVSESPRWQ